MHDLSHCPTFIQRCDTRVRQLLEILHSGRKIAGRNIGSVIIETVKAVGNHADSYAGSSNTETRPSIITALYGIPFAVDRSVRRTDLRQLNLSQRRNRSQPRDRGYRKNSAHKVLVGDSVYETQFRQGVQKTLSAVVRRRRCINGDVAVQLTSIIEGNPGLCQLTVNLPML